MVDQDSEREPGGSTRGPTVGETTRDFLYLLLSVGSALLGLGSVLSALEGLYSVAVTDGVVAVLLAYLYYRFGRNRRKGAIHNLNL